MSLASTFQSAITEADGKSVNVAYLTMFGLAAMVLGAIPVLTIGSFVEMYLNPQHVFRVEDLGIAIGVLCTGFSTCIGAVGLFLKGDRSNS